MGVYDSEHFLEKRTNCILDPEVLLVRAWVATAATVFEVVLIAEGR